MADGKLYVGTESGKFFIVRPHADRAEILSEVELPHEPRRQRRAVGRHPRADLRRRRRSRAARVFFVSTGGVYAIGPKAAKATTGVAVDAPQSRRATARRRWVQVTPRPSWC